MRWAEHVACTGQMRCINILVAKPEGKRRLERRWRGWEDNIKMDKREYVWRVRIGLIRLSIGTGGRLL
jgi:hypothetical protein